MCTIVDISIWSKISSKILHCDKFSSQQTYKVAEINIIDKKFVSF